MSKSLKNLILLIINISLILSLCVEGENYCLRCNPITKLCVKCEANIYIPNEKGGCENAKKCYLGKGQCLECNELGNLCKECISGYFPDENGGCSYTDNCEISYEGNCLKCKDNFILIGLNNTSFIEIKICKSLIEGDLKNCKIINKEKGICEECREGFYLNSGDKKCSQTENCFESTFDICSKCNNGYYLDKIENKCKLQDEIFRHCIQTIDGKSCDICEEDFYFDEFKSCTSIKYCSKSLNNYKCEKCISGYYLTKYGNACTPEKNCHIGNKDLGICIECNDNYFIDYNDGKCKSNQEDNDYKYCYQADNGLCNKCLINYKLGIDIRCTSTWNCVEADKGKCIQCKENYYLGLDNKCSITKNCIYSTDNICLECDKDLYFNRNNMTCISDEGIFKNCKYSDYMALNCEECKKDFYLNKSDNLCYSNLDEDSLFYKCSRTDFLAQICNMCIEGYHIGSKDRKCNKNYGCAISENENICIECDEFYCLDKKTGKCEDNEQIFEEEKKFYFKCNYTNEEGTACEKCVNGYTLNDNGLCIDDEHCIEINEDGTCKKCHKLENDDDIYSYCLNDIFRCAKIYIGDYNCLECNNILDFYNCTKCEEGYKLDKFGYCEEIEKEE